MNIIQKPTIMEVTYCGLDLGCGQQLVMAGLEAQVAQAALVDLFLLGVQGDHGALTEGTEDDKLAWWQRHGTSW